jgi:hypothetical protein
MFELEALVTDTSGPEADCDVLPPEPVAGAVLGSAVFPELGTSGVTTAGAVVPGAATFCGPAPAAWAVAPADGAVEV